MRLGADWVSKPNLQSLRVAYLPAAGRSGSGNPEIAFGASRVPTYVSPNTVDEVVGLLLVAGSCKKQDCSMIE